MLKQSLPVRAPSLLAQTSGAVLRPVEATAARHFRQVETIAAAGIQSGGRRARGQAGAAGLGTGACGTGLARLLAGGYLSQQRCKPDNNVPLPVRRAPSIPGVRHADL